MQPEIPSSLPTCAPRKTFAIISHPDAGKTTLTEKLLLYGNAIELAGNVRARRSQRATTSDWMEMERERGISITSTILQFPYKNHIINLLDTPGHQDFSEDTYRTLAAVDSAVMVIDAAKGIEPQTLKLFEVCRKRGIPIFTFINKMDRPVLDPFDLLDEIKKILGMEPVPMNWPLGDGIDFKGVYDRASGGVYVYERTERNERAAAETFIPLEELASSGLLSPARVTALKESVDLLDEVGMIFDHQSVLQEKQTPVFFGSALTNFGVRLFLEAFVKIAPPPQPYLSDVGIISPDMPEFSGFIFKIQANMNPKHRDSVAFLRICSGHFERGMDLLHAQSGKTLRLLRPYKLFASEREIIDEAYPGDVLGLPNSGDFAIGDTLCSGAPIRFAPIPRFQPEHFAMLRNTDLNKQKQFSKGLLQLESEGAVQVLYNINAFKREPILAVVGQLQFDVVQSRLKTEYGVPTTLERMPHTHLRWIKGPEAAIEALPERNDAIIARDSRNDWVALFSSAFFCKYYAEKYPELRFVEFEIVSP
ncbi:MAG: peptide chain release factor 3 [Anaerolineae bacterium CG_4_9_14_3_um_filter_57_17]|nr:peptide chain release factor 3 [bacterium]NCT20463.1 peptide chain release factor 3 [bacterium]OIO83985.1 MAG: peptide chain release factor 3 [Anaerolineae bacterium CG2_30_57_67]PJB65068.1 MAG: peptide chain release factor 3 [Anaerolineae bacterium CG_4_9_14_3_um_filter_57_17]